MGCAFPQAKCEHNLKMKSMRPAKKSQKIDCRRRSTQFIDAIVEHVQIEDQHLTQQEKIFAQSILKKHYLFGQLDDHEIQQIVQQIVIAMGFQKQYVFKEGQKGSCFFIIAQGNVQVEVQGIYTRTLKRGDSFGELALLYASSRTASIKCSQQCKFFIVKSTVFRNTLKQINVKNYQIVKNCLNKVQAFTFLTNKQKASLSNILVKNHFLKNEVIFEANTLAHAFYIILQGKVQIIISDSEKVILGKYDSFGENAFWDRGRRAGTVKTLQNTTCLVIGKNQIKRTLGNNFNSIIYFNIQKWALRKSKLFCYLSNNQIDKLTAEFKVKFAKQNQILMMENEYPSAMLISIEGKINNQMTGEIFCEQYFGKPEKKLPKSIIKTDPGIYSYLEFNKLDKILSNFKLNKRGSRYSTLSNKQNLGKENLIQINVANFQFIKKLGEGQYGKVYLVRDPTLRGATFAVKCLDKASIIKDSMQNCVIYQKRILESISFPYIVGYVNSFADTKSIFIVTEFIEGVQMFDAIRQIGILNKAIARYYIGCLLLSVEYLHSQNIIYRDLKPENSVVDHTGKVFLIDMGTAKVLKAQAFYRTFSIIGTPHYLAPEVMRGKGYTFQADYWCLGVVLYEFICGKLPYGQNLEDPYAIYAQVLENELTFPKNFLDQQAKSLIRKLMHKNSSERSSNGKFEGIKNSPYFSGFFWEDLSNQKLKPPYILKKYKNGILQNYLESEAKPFLKQIYPGKKNKQFAEAQVIAQWNEKFN